MPRESARYGSQGLDPNPREIAAFSSRLGETRWLASEQPGSLPLAWFFTGAQQLDSQLSRRRPGVTFEETPPPPLGMCVVASGDPHETLLGESPLISYPALKVGGWPRF
jgi:hypothetical protein